MYIDTLVLGMYMIRVFTFVSNNDEVKNETQVMSLFIYVPFSHGRRWQRAQLDLPSVQ